MSEFRLCSRCVMPESKPNLSFNSEGVCNACQNTSEEVDWDSRWDDLVKIADSVKSHEGYNILIPVSGGKDST